MNESEFEGLVSELSGVKQDTVNKVVNAIKEALPIATVQAYLNNDNLTVRSLFTSYLDFTPSKQAVKYNTETNKFEKLFDEEGNPVMTEERYYPKLYFSNVAKMKTDALAKESIEPPTDDIENEMRVL